MTERPRPLFPPTLYLMLGYPGAGKTTTATVIQAITGAEHIWADHERRQMFGEPEYTQAENDTLYDKLNRRAENLITEGKSVIFDTNFGFYNDRQRLIKIAARHGAQTVIVWVQTPKSLAKHRATDNASAQHTRVLGDMPPERFDRISGNLQPPQPDEPVITIDGTKVTDAYVRERLGL